MLKNLRFNHMGLALGKDDDALVFLGGMGYTAGVKIFDPLQNVHVRLLTSPTHPTVEIITPGDGKSPIEQIISKYNEMIYHTCYETDDLEATLADLEAKNLRCLLISERKPAILFGGRHVSFYRIIGWGIVEFLEGK